MSKAGKKIPLCDHVTMCTLFLFFFIAIGLFLFCIGCVVIIHVTAKYCVHAVNEIVLPIKVTNLSNERKWNQTFRHNLWLKVDGRWSKWNDSSGFFLCFCFGHEIAKFGSLTQSEYVCVYVYTVYMVNFICQRFALFLKIWNSVVNQWNWKYFMSISETRQHACYFDPLFVYGWCVTSERDDFYQLLEFIFGLENPE